MTSKIEAESASVDSNEESLNIILYENLIKIVNHVLKKKVPLKNDPPHDPIYIKPIITNSTENDIERKKEFQFLMKNVQFQESSTSNQFHDVLISSITLHCKKKLKCSIEIFFRLGSSVYMQFFFRSFQTENSTFSYNNRHEFLTIFYNWLHVDTKTYSYPIAIAELMRLKGEFHKEKDKHPTDSIINEILFKDSS